MSTDRELLERAARAADVFLTKERLKKSLPKWEWENDWEPCHLAGGGMRGIDLWFGSAGEIGGTESKEWHPLTDDGDAFRLAVKLKIDLIHDDPQANDAFVMAGSLDHVEDVDGEASRTSAARRAIVRAAAALAGDAP